MAKGEVTHKEEPQFVGGEKPERQITQTFTPLSQRELNQKYRVKHDSVLESDGRLVVDIEEAKAEFGAEVASRLKTDPKNPSLILWPQPSDAPEDPQNWPAWKKDLQLFVLAAAAFVPDYSSSLGIASLFLLAAQYNTTTDEINNLTSNWSIFMLGWGGLISVFLTRRFGRLPVLFYSQLFGLGWIIGCTLAPSLGSFAAFRILAATFQTAPQVLGLYTVTDMYPFHLQARKLALWVLVFIFSPFCGPSFQGFMVARTSWRAIYGVGCGVQGFVLLLIIFLARETMFDRHLHPIPIPKSTGLRLRIENLLGITGWRMRRLRTPIYIAVLDMADVVWRPQALIPLIYVMWVFGFGIGINVTNAVFTGSPPPLGYGLKPDQQAGTYFSPILGSLIGELLGRYLNDWIANRLIRRNHGVFLAEFRLWTLYIALLPFVVGFVILGSCFQYKLNVGGLVMGWILAEIGIIMTTVAIYAYLNNAFPYHQGEVSALINLFRVLGGFAVPYFQIEWAEKSGPLQVFGCEAAAVAGLFFLLIPFLQWKGEAIRAHFSLKRR